MSLIGAVKAQEKQRAGPRAGGPHAAPAPSRAEAGLPRFLRAGLIQAKLRVNQPGDAFEQEADALAGTLAHAGAQAGPAPTRTCACGRPIAAGGECAACRARRLAGGAAGTLQRAAAPKAPARRAPHAANPLAGTVASTGVPLAAAERARFEPALGMDLGHVRLHTTGAAAQAADSLQARAFTAGSDVYFQRGEYAPGTAGGQRLLAHELVHVAQQTGDARGSGPAMRAGGPRLHAGAPLIQRQVCENPDELVQGALPGLLREEGYVPPPPEVLAEMISAADFQARTGVHADQLPEEAFVGVDRLAGGDVTQGPNYLPDLNQVAATAGVGAAVNVPVPMSVVPPNSIGLLWTSGHLSIFANVEGNLNVRGFRGHLAWHAGADFLPGPLGRWFSLQLNLGVSGAMRGDRLFALMGKQSVIYLEVDAATARGFSGELSQARYDQPYRYSPADPKAESAGERRMAERVARARGPAQAMMCTNNCITVPLREVEAVLGRHPAAQGVDIATGQRAGGAYDPHAKGRARLMTEYMRNPDLAGGRPGLSTVEVTPGAARVIGYTRVGGGILMIYGIYQTGSHLREAWGTEDFPLVAMQEGFTWTGAIAGSAAGAQIGMLACAPGGPISLVCAAGGFLAGLVGGFIGGAIGSLILPIAVHFANTIIQATLLFIEGYVGALEFGRRLSEGFTEMLFTNLFTKRYEISPCNWDLSALPQDPREDIYALGIRLWKQAGVETADTLLSNLNRPISSYTVPAVLMGHVAADLSQLEQQRGFAETVFTPAMIGELTPYEFAEMLLNLGLLRYKYDPALLGRIAMLPDEQAAP